MGRSNASARSAGTAFERLMADHFASVLDDDRIDRRPKNGNKDRGDIGGVRCRGWRVVVECKDYGGQIKAADWTAEAETERVNDDALAGLVVAKRRGTRVPGAQWVFMTVDDLAALLTGTRPTNEGACP